MRPVTDTARRAARVSLIICTRNRARQLALCLEAVRRIRCRDDWELVVVDNGSTDETGKTIAGFAEESGIAVIPVRETKPGLGHARNAGVAAASGEILAFIDDDCYPAPDLLDRIIETFARHPIGWLGGCIRLHDHTDFPLTISLVERDLLLPAGRYLWPGLIQGANMALRRLALEHIGGFDPELGPGTPFILDDLDAVARASAAGFDGGFFTGPVVYHHHGRKRADAARLQRIYDRAHGVYFAKLLLHSATRRRFGLRVLGELCRSALRRPRTFRREMAGAVEYLRRQRMAGSAAAGFRSLSNCSGS
jgi:glycosyltransferase involved in cell wall biosynthesis